MHGTVFIGFHLTCSKFVHRSIQAKSLLLITEQFFSKDEFEYFRVPLFNDHWKPKIPIDGQGMMNISSHDVIHFKIKFSKCLRDRFSIPNLNLFKLGKWMFKKFLMKHSKLIMAINLSFKTPTNRSKIRNEFFRKRTLNKTIY